MTDELSPADANSEFLLYTAPDGEVRAHVLLRDETVWLPQKGLAELFGVTVASISRHLKNIFESSELQEKAVVTVFETTAADGKRYRTRFYNLDAIIAVGYRVNSFEATPSSKGSSDWARPRRPRRTTMAEASVPRYDHCHGGARQTRTNRARRRDLRKPRGGRPGELRILPLAELRAAAGHRARAGGAGS